MVHLNIKFVNTHPMEVIPGVFFYVQYAIDMCFDPKMLYYPHGHTFTWVVGRYYLGEEK